LQRALESGILINVTAENVVRLLPPLIFTDSEADMLVEKLDEVVRAFLGEK
jgi:acetylornithine aminotransferase